MISIRKMVLKRGRLFAGSQKVHLELASVWAVRMEGIPKEIK